MNLLLVLNNLWNKHKRYDTKIYLIEGQSSEVLRSFGEQVHKHIKSMMYVNGVTVLTDVTFKVNNLKQSYNVEELLIKDSNYKEYTICPDMVLTQNHVDASNLAKMERIYFDDPNKFRPSISERGIFHVDSLSSLKYK